MQSLCSLRQDPPGLEGPDYVALVIEWNDDATAPSTSPAIPGPARPAISHRAVAAVLGALGAIALAAWGIHRLRTA